MSERIWLPAISTCESVHFLPSDVLEERDYEICLELMAQSGQRYALRLSPDAYEALYERMGNAFETSAAPLRATRRPRRLPPGPRRQRSEPKEERAADGRGAAAMVRRVVDRLRGFGQHRKAPLSLRDLDKERQETAR